MQVNSLGLTEQQPENNVPRIALEALGVILSRRARARAIQLPAWNEALGLPQPWDQQWSLRMQQILAYETDLLEYGDILDGSHVIESLTSDLTDAAQAELDDLLVLGGAFGAIETMKARLVASQSERTRRIESGDQVVVGVNRFTTTEESPLGGTGSILQVDPTVEAFLVEDVTRWRETRDGGAVTGTLDRLRRGSGGRRAFRQPDDGEHQLARAGGTTGEWAGALRQVWGEYRAPTGLGGRRPTTRWRRATGCGARQATKPLPQTRQRAANLHPPRQTPLAATWTWPASESWHWPANTAARLACSWPSQGSTATATGPSRSQWPPVTPASKWSTRASGNRRTDRRRGAREDVDVIGLSILSGSHMNLVEDVRDHLLAAGVDVPLVVEKWSRRRRGPTATRGGGRLHPRTTSWGRSWSTWPTWLPPASTPRCLPADWFHTRRHAVQSSGSGSQTTWRSRRASSRCLRTVPSAIPRTPPASWTEMPTTKQRTAQARRFGGIRASSSSTASTLVVSWSGARAGGSKAATSEVQADLPLRALKQAKTRRVDVAGRIGTFTDAPPPGKCPGERLLSQLFSRTPFGSPNFQRSDQPPVVGDVALDEVRARVGGRGARLAHRSHLAPHSRLNPHTRRRRALGPGRPREPSDSLGWPHRRGRSSTNSMVATRSTR